MIHPTSEVNTKNIGKNTLVWQYCVILEGAIIGDNCNINFNVFIENHVTIGNNVTIKSGVQIWDGVTLGDNVFVGPNATFTNDRIPRSKMLREQFKYIDTKVCAGASIGANATITPGVAIGEFAFIGAGSVVTKNVPAYTIWYGNPAKHKGYITEQGIMLDLNLIDKTNNTKYNFINGKPVIVK